MDRKEAIDAISDGHAMFTVSYAAEVLRAFSPGAELPEHIVTRWTGQKDANPDGDPKGLFLHEDEPGEGVHSLRLSAFIARLLTGSAPGDRALGRGTAARMNAKAVADFLAKETK